MANIYDAGLDRDLALLTTHIADFNLQEPSYAETDLDHNLQIKGEDDDFALHSRSFILEELLETGEDDMSTLEVYKDILNEKIHSKTKIPTPSATNHMKRHSITLSPRITNNSLTDSKLPVSVSSKDTSRRTPNPVDSISPMRSVSESPLKVVPRLKAFWSTNRFGDSNTYQSPCHTDLSQKRRKFLSMGQPTKRLLSAPIDASLNQSTSNMLPSFSSVSPQSRLPSYLKQTTSSLRKAAPYVIENKENQQNNTRLTSASAVYNTERTRRRKSHSGFSQHSSFKAPASHELLDTLSEGSSRFLASKQDLTPTHMLHIPKVRQRKILEKVINERPSFVGNHDKSTPGNNPKIESSTTASSLKRVTRSQTQNNLKISLNTTNSSNHTIPKGRKTSGSLDKRKTSGVSKDVRSTSITASQKISSVGDLYKNISKSSLVKTWERVQKHKFAKVDPIEPKNLKNHARFQLLNNYERGEILRRSQIFYVGEKRKPEVEVLNFNKNFGFDDKEGNYLFENGDHIHYRYRVLSKLGNGAFGSVVACNDYKQDRICAVKIVKNEMTCSLQAVNEVKILKTLAENNPGRYCFMQYFGHFHFRGHMCISTEYLPINMYQVLEVSNFKGFKMSVISNFASQILRALEFLHFELKLIHCDLKPENLMLVSPYSFDLKIIDFGSAVPINEISYSYLQSRFYRAPEVTLGARYNEKIDIWSFATILVELFTGVPLFPCENESDLMVQYLELLGEPQSKVIQQLRTGLYNEGAVGSNLNDSSLLWQIFTGKGDLMVRELQARVKGKAIKTGSKSFNSILRTYNFSDDTTESYLLELFIDFISKCFVWDYHKRENAKALLCHDLLAGDVVK